MKKSGLADSPFFAQTVNAERRPDTSLPSLINLAPVPNQTVKDDMVRTPERVNRRTDEQANARTGELPKSLSGKRVIKRQSYNVYADQHEALQRLEATGSLSGKGIFISEMVREALDDYLKNEQ